MYIKNHQLINQLSNSSLSACTWKFNGYHTYVCLNLFLSCRAYCIQKLDESFCGFNEYAIFIPGTVVVAVDIVVVAARDAAVVVVRTADT